ncbi:MAG: efflux RND transporter permease subunit, partial [Oceanidesulfovibrio sp.]
MKRLAEFSVNNPVTVNLVMITILVMGVVLYKYQMPKEIFPEFSENQIVVTTVYPGASAYEIEKNVTLKIEEALSDLDHVEEISSVTQESLSIVTIKISPEARNYAKIISDAQQAVDQIDEFPQDAEDPVIQEMDSDIPVITVSLYGDVNLKYLKDIVEDLEEEIQTVPGVSEVRLSGLPEREIWVEVRPETLDRYGLTLADISNAIRERNFDLPGGTLPTSQGE